MLRVLQRLAEYLNFLGSRFSVHSHLPFDYQEPPPPEESDELELLPESKDELLPLS